MSNTQTHVNKQVSGVYIQGVYIYNNILYLYYTIHMIYIYYLNIY